MRITQGASFQKELKKLTKRYRTLPEDLKILENLISKFPDGSDSRHCHVLKEDGRIRICKRRMMCRAVKGSEFRIVYFHDGDAAELLHLEIFFKGDKANEDRQRIEIFWQAKLNRE